LEGTAGDDAFSRERGGITVSLELFLCPDILPVYVDGPAQDSLERNADVGSGIQVHPVFYYPPEDAQAQLDDRAQVSV
jgi:hypothetical protein